MAGQRPRRPGPASPEELRAEAAAADPALDAAALRAELAELLAQHRRLRRRLEKLVAISDGYQAQLRQARDDVSQLRDLFLPICMFCKRVRSDDDYWQKIESYFTRHAAVTFSHGICPACMDQRFGQPGGAPAATTTPAARPAPAGRPRGGEEPALAALRAALARAGGAGGEAAAAVEAALGDCARAFSRYRKVVEISDGYQEEFRTRLEAAVRFDPLTGLAGRIVGMEAVEAAWMEERRGGTRAALLVADLDAFRQVNLRWGYEAGDRAIIELGRILRTIFPAPAVRARWEGDAFAVLLPGATVAEAEARAGRLVRAAAGARVPAGGSALDLGVSVGVGGGAGSASVHAWVVRVEEALQRAKRDGGGRVVVAPPGDAGPGSPG